MEEGYKKKSWGWKESCELGYGSEGHRVRQRTDKEWESIQQEANSGESKRAVN